jgi:hypothetical protein
MIKRVAETLHVRANREFGSLFIGRARAAELTRIMIAAMREPDGTMVAAAQWGTMDGASVDVEAIWRAMIDEAVKE